MSQFYTISASDLHHQSRVAKRAALLLREICGLIIRDPRNRKRLRLLPVKNSAMDVMCFAITATNYRATCRLNGVSERRIIGTYHSHPLSPAEPGQGDIEGTWNGALMLIFAPSNKDARLWKIKAKTATPAILIPRRD